MKLIITSANINAEKFSSYFFECPIFTILGQTYSVGILYMNEPDGEYFDTALIAIMQTNMTGLVGDILLFLAG